ncbi:tRNA 2-thiouridine synthesizing protein C [Mesocricetibacter intestinalis]|uniref:tRNA 2-thiouridine synthesizing protein C n=1 Tax=Mesocricetibacter intestinalis TaxID=1521930 RepID=A0A4R6VBX8_9PAST|nr:sulfurtransferase complex subunit TusC [Mesocricetibacter intestinalis]TDQ57579.1 tRNA 2-thiouridine synthesizing protein C [Mesocricetibacter intestinalis]
MTKLAFVFRSSPYGTSDSREGLDALLAATAFCNEEDIAVYFIDDGVFNLLKGQNPALILQKDFIAAFKLLDLYEIKQRYICCNSLERYGLEARDLIIDCETVRREELCRRLQHSEKLLTF